jgi:hypothetical protein
MVGVGVCVFLFVFDVNKMRDVMELFFNIVAVLCNVSYNILQSVISPYLATAVTLQ